MNDDDREFENYESSADQMAESIEELEERIRAIESHGKDTVSAGYVLGMTIAVVLSWSRNASILWCILHGLLSWIYVIYYAFTR